MPLNKHSSLKNFSSEITLISNRIRFSILLISVLLIILLFRLLYLSVIEHTYYLDLLQKNQYKLVAIPPDRGLIFDRHGVILAENKPVFSLAITPEKTKNLEQTLTAINKILPLTTDERDAFWKQLKLHYKTDAIPLVVNLNEEQLAKFSVNQYQFPEATLQANLLRYYPQGALFEDVVGFVGRINETDINTIDKINYQASNFIGKTGVEQYYETSLHGKIGYQKIQMNAFGKLIKQLDVTPPISGDNLYLTLDSKLQTVAYQALQGSSGALVAIDPNTGEVLALVSHPGFDPNLFVNGLSEKHYQTLLQDPRRPLVNRALRGLYPFGSTVKPFYAIAALNDHLVTADFTLPDPGYFILPNSRHVFHDHLKDGHGNIDISRAIWVSCDTFFYYLANLMGIDKMDATLTDFGFGEAPPIDLVNALAGNLPSPSWKMHTFKEPWYPGDTVITGIGQGSLEVTPLQLADGVSAIAMRGQRFKPTVLLKTTDAAQHTQFIAPQPLPAAPFNDPLAWKTVINAMANVITNDEGTGFRFGRDAPYTAAGKTGTAQVISLTHTREFAVVPENLRDDSLFIVFAPIDHPKIAVAVVAEHSKQAPAIARQVIDAYMQESQQ